MHFRESKTSIIPCKDLINFICSRFLSQLPGDFFEPVMVGVAVTIQKLPMTTHHSIINTISPRYCILTTSRK